MIHEPKKMLACGKAWYYQEFTPDNPQDEYAVNLYDSNGDFVRDFDSLEETKQWVKKLELLKPLLTHSERKAILDMCQLGIFNFYHASQQAYFPNEYEKNILQDLFTLVYFAGKKG